jgi:hypothetical protein
VLCRYEDCSAVVPAESVVVDNFDNPIAHDGAREMKYVRASFLASGALRSGADFDCRNRRRVLESKEADVAQLVEQPIRNRQVTSSTLVVGSNFHAVFIPAQSAPRFGAFFIAARRPVPEII